MIPDESVPATIQIVDNNPQNLALLTAVLAKQGYEVRTAIGRTLALKSVQERVPDLILLDIRMLRRYGRLRRHHGRRQGGHRHLYPGGHWLRGLLPRELDSQINLGFLSAAVSSIRFCWQTEALGEVVRMVGLPAQPTGHSLRARPRQSSTDVIGSRM